jgi:hypothetical protein
MNPKMLATLLVVCVAAGFRTSAQIYDTNGDYVETFAGSGFSGYLDGVGQETMFNFLSCEGCQGTDSIVADTSGNLFVVDADNYRIRKITPDGTVTTFAGNGGGYCYPPPPGYGANVSLCGCLGPMAIDHANVLQIVSSGSGQICLVSIGPDAFVSQIILTNVPSYVGGICVDSHNNIYFSTQNQIFRCQSNGVLTVFAGSGNSGLANGNGLFTSFCDPEALAIDPADNIYVWDMGNELIRRIDPSQNVTTYAGTRGGADQDGLGANAVFVAITAMCSDSSGNLILTDPGFYDEPGSGGSCVREITAATNVLTLAGSFTQVGYANGPGDSSEFDSLSGACYVNGVIYVVDSGNERIRSITNNFTEPPIVQASLQLSLQLNTNAGLTITGGVGQTYKIQSSPDLSTWTSQATIVLSSSPFLWIDPTPMSGNKFYRAVSVP